MTKSATAITEQVDSTTAGEDLGRQIRETFKGQSADAVVLFASARHDYSKLLAALAEASGTEIIVGSSSAGEFTHLSRGEGYASALGLRAGGTMRFAAAVGRELAADPRAAARRVAESFEGMGARPLPYRYALVMTDALAGYTDTVVEELTIATGGNYGFFGGGAGDDGRFQKTHVFSGIESFTNAVVALEIQSEQPIGVGVSHGWVPASDGFRVTEADGMRLVSLNGAPAIVAFEEYADATGQKLDRANPLPFFLHNILGIKSGVNHRLRVPLGVYEDGSVACAAAIPSGVIVHIMKTTEASAALAAEQATRAALAGLTGRKPGAALVFDCVATRMRLGRAFDEELKACATLLEPAGFVGCNTYGQIARAEGQFGGFHNCTAVVCVLPE
jgi:hypothetical protein